MLLGNVPLTAQVQVLASMLRFTAEDKETLVGARGRNVLEQCLRWSSTPNKAAVSDVSRSVPPGGQSSSGSTFTL